MLWLKFASHLFFIYLSHFLLTDVIDWSRLVKRRIENHRKIRVFVLLIAIGLGYLVSTFFLDLMAISRGFSELIRNN